MDALDTFFFIRNWHREPPQFDPESGWTVERWPDSVPFTALRFPA